MGSLAPTTVVVVLACVLVSAAAVVAATLQARSARARGRRLDAELARSRSEVDALHERVDLLGSEVVQARHDADEQRRRDLESREYVITSLAVTGAAPDQEPVVRTPVAQVLEDQLLDSLARQQGRSALRTRAVDVVVRTVSLGHGVRRALTPEILDRAAAEAHVARRRSRRVRRQELREARRLVRAVRAHRTASTTGRRAA